MPLFLREADVTALLSIEEAFRAQAAGQAANQPRRRVRWPGGALHGMAAGGPGLGYVGRKAYTTVGG
ncbi:MAG: hypothetical protein C4313_09310 [Thermoflexus sp.]|uniref:hypothetical protein n=1 Tax=Thermoflexus sp. TaxID=1969742 RepID=UPI0033181800